MYSMNSSGKFLHRSSILVFILVSLIFLYFNYLVSAFKPCQGSFPFRKYIKTCPSPSRSSLLDYSTPI